MDKYISSTALQVVARSKTFSRFDSTSPALVPTSATPMENNGFRAAVAIVCAGKMSLTKLRWEGKHLHTC